MIVDYEEGGWKIITQRAHGILAGQFASHWKFRKFPPRWTELQLAIAEHDDAEIELDGENLLTPQGGPLNYDMKSFDLPHCLKVSEFSVTKSRYIALLTSVHMNFLYDRDAPSNKQAEKFLQMQREKQARLMKELNMSKQEVEKDYALLEWCDALSLLVCQNKILPEQRSVEISKGPDNRQYLLHQTGPGELTVSPWPFKSMRFPVCVEYRMIRQLQFPDSAAFRKAFYEAQVLEKGWTFAK